MSIKMKPTAHPKEFTCTYIDRDVQKMYQPLNLMQQLTLNPKYQIKAGFIKPNNVKSILLSFCGLISYVGVSIYRVWELATDENMQRYTPIKFLNFATLIDASFNSTGYIMNFILPIIEVKQNITFILTFQEIHRFIHKTDNCKIIVNNWISVITYFSFYIFACIYIYVYYMPNWYVMYYVFILCTRDTNPIYAIGVIKLLTEKVFLWNSELLMSSKAGHREMRCDRMFRAYGHILSCYDVYKNIFQIPVSIIFGKLRNYNCVYIKSSFLFLN
ncbi:hypothetical protein B5X24_HaOG200698 [Helicoverpa armigera]|uniref:Gustatory receptor n=1 Tax=Helicoverpa armigera TaxID=29058 RepID=A0A2W1BPR9_HELAM|nr:hypothetical protein B5X24_HaOG200698 [Helicoverpa armigera]